MYIYIPLPCLWDVRYHQVGLMATVVCFWRLKRVVFVTAHTFYVQAYRVLTLK